MGAVKNPIPTVKMSERLIGVRPRYHSRKRAIDGGCVGRRIGIPVIREMRLCVCCGRDAARAEQAVVVLDDGCSTVIELELSAGSVRLVGIVKMISDGGELAITGPSGLPKDGDRGFTTRHQIALDVAVLDYDV